MTVRYVEHSARAQRPVGDPAFHEWSSPDGAVWTHFYRQEKAYVLRFPEFVDFEVSSDGYDVQAWPTPSVSPGTVQHLFLNQVLPLAMSRQGRLVLHGSAVDVNGRGVAFVGASGQGKSTLAACFATGGGRFLTDDGLHLEWVDGTCTVIPSHPSIRLWEDSQEALIAEAVLVAPPLEFTSKARLLAGADVAFCAQPLPLGCVYFLGGTEVSSVVITRLPPAAAMIELVKNAFLLDVEDRNLLALHFDELSQLANLPIYYHLDYPRRYECLPQVRASITSHCIEQVSHLL